MSIGSKMSSFLIGAAAVGLAPLATGGPMNGMAGQIPAYYHGDLVTINRKEMPSSAALIRHNPNLSTIYVSNDLDEAQTFTPVIPAVPGDRGFNPLCRQVLIVFNPGFPAHQFTSDADIRVAAAGNHPAITLVLTDEVYRCAVVGSR